MESVLMKNGERLLKKSSLMISKEATTIPRYSEFLFIDQLHQKMLLYDTRLFPKCYKISELRMILSPLPFPSLFPTFYL